MARELIDKFTERIAEKARPAGDVNDLVRQNNWTTRDLARALDTSERTARRYRQQNRIPERRREQFSRAARDAAERRIRRRMSTRGLDGLTAHGRYRVSRSVYETHPDAPARLLPGNHIAPGTMRDIFDALDRGDADGANDLLERALSDGYGASNPLHWERVDDLDYKTR